MRAALLFSDRVSGVSFWASRSLGISTAASRAAKLVHLLDDRGERCFGLAEERFEAIERFVEDLLGLRHRAGKEL